VVSSPRLARIKLPKQAAILILNRSSFAEGLLTEAERARSGDLCPSQSKLEP
jgi:hypothetical protein